MQPHRLWAVFWPNDGSSVREAASVDPSCKQANANVHFHVKNEQKTKASQARMTRRIIQAEILNLRPREEKIEMQTKQILVFQHPQNALKQLILSKNCKNSSTFEDLSR